MTTNTHRDPLLEYARLLSIAKAQRLMLKVDDVLVELFTPAGQVFKSNAELAAMVDRCVPPEFLAQ